MWITSIQCVEQSHCNNWHPLPITYRLIDSYRAIDLIEVVVCCIYTVQMVKFPMINNSTCAWLAGFYLTYCEISYWVIIVTSCSTKCVLLLQYGIWLCIQVLLLYADVNAMSHGGQGSISESAASSAGGNYTLENSCVFKYSPDYTYINNETLSKLQHLGLAYYLYTALYKR